jgi:hypothetical protein
MPTRISIAARGKLSAVLGSFLSSLLLCMPSPTWAETVVDRSEIVDAARKYLQQGLVEHKPDLVPLATHCWRVEQGSNTGRSGSEIKLRLLRDEYKAITGIDEKHWLVEGDQAVVFYDLHLSSLPSPVLIAERFKVRNGLIEEIEALFYRPPPSD